MKKHFLKYLLIISIVLLFVFLLAIETSLRKLHGIPPLEPDPPQFKYQYVDIYKKCFKKIRKENKDVYIPQEKRDLCASEFPVVKSPKTIRIFIIGGSVAQGFDELSFLEDMLKNAVADKEFEVINCGIGAYDSYRTYLVLKEILSYQPDLLIVLSGNNEFYNKVKINVRIYYINKFLRRFWIYRIVQDRILQWSSEQGVLYYRNIKRKFIDYEKNIRLIVKKAKAKRIPVILCTVPLNLKGYPSGERPLNKQFFSALLSLEEGDYSRAIDGFKGFQKDNPDNPFGFHSLGRVYEKIEDYQRAKEYYSEAMDLTFGDSGSASPSSNKIIRQVAIDEEVDLVDFELALMDTAPHHLPGREQFFDHCHGYHEYYSLGAELIVRKILQNSIRDLNIISSERHKSDLFLPFHNFPSLKDRGKRKKEGWRAMQVAVWVAIKSNDRLSDQAIWYFETLYLMDTDLLWNIQYLKKETIKSLLDAPWIGEYMPNFIIEEHWPSVLYHIGETYRRTKLYEKSLIYFNKAIFLDGKNYLSYIGRALVYYARGDKQKTQENIQRAEEISDSLEVQYYKELLKARL